MTITALAATDLPVTLTIEQTGRLLGISRSAAYRAAAAGQIPTFRVGRRLLVPTARLLEMLGIEPEEVACHRRGQQLNTDLSDAAAGLTISV